MSDLNHQPILSQKQIDSVISLYSNGQYQEAIDAIKLLNQSYPNVPLLFNLIGACYKELGQLKGAAKMFEVAINLKPDYAECHKNLGITLIEIGHLEDSAETLKRAIEVNPSYVDAYYNLAITLKNLGQIEAAI